MFHYVSFRRLQRISPPRSTSDSAASTGSSSGDSFRAARKETVADPGHLPTVTAEVVESAVLLAKAELKLALIEARGLAQKAIGALALVVFAGFLLHASVLLLVLGPLVSVNLSETAKWALIVAPVVLALVVGWFAVRSVRGVHRHER